ncbi:unnamed protein product, partial [Urochloa humidicola]
NPILSFSFVLLLFAAALCFCSSSDISARAQGFHECMPEAKSKTDASLPSNRHFNRSSDLPMAQ